MIKQKLGVVLFQLGGPDGRESIEPFLRNLFNDPDILMLPMGGGLRNLLAGFIAKRRAPKVARLYDKIGGRSPILDITERQASALQEALSAGYDPRVVIAMRYSPPFTAEAARRLHEFSPDEVVLLPLYPQYSMVTTGSSFKEWNKQKAAGGFSFKVEKRIESYYLDRGYIASVIEGIRESLTKLNEDSRKRIHLLFSAHGLPERYIARGDPYKVQVEGTVRAVMKEGGFANSHSIAFQSRVGPLKWIEPYIKDEISNLARTGKRDLLLIPISFVSDHLETIYELGMKFRETARLEGIVSYHVVPALNDSLRFIEALKELVVAKVEGS